MFASVALHTRSQTDPPPWASVSICMQRLKESPRSLPCLVAHHWRVFAQTHTFMSLMPSLPWKCLPTSQPNHTAYEEEREHIVFLFQNHTITSYLKRPQGKLGCLCCHWLQVLSDFRATPPAPGRLTSSVTLFSFRLVQIIMYWSIDII